MTAATAMALAETPTLKPVSQKAKTKLQIYLTKKSFNFFTRTKKTRLTVDVETGSTGADASIAEAVAASVGKVLGAVTVFAAENLQTTGVHGNVAHLADALIFVALGVVASHSLTFRVSGALEQSYGSRLTIQGLLKSLAGVV